MNIALLSDSQKMPNLALMKIAKYHRLRGDRVNIFLPLFAHEYDKVYYSKIFTFTSLNLYAHGNIEKGGTGFDIKKELSAEIDALPCDYSIYPDCDYAMGFLTRGCIRSCPWCVVPEKEGNIKPYRSVEQIVRDDTNKIVFMDNNVLASHYGLQEIEKLTELPYYVDFNQGLDARLISQEVANILARIKWQRYVRVSCDTLSMLDYIKTAYERLCSAGYTKELFCYVLGKDVDTTLYILSELKLLKITPFMQPYRDLHVNQEPPALLKQMASWCNMMRQFKKYTFEEWLISRNALHLLDEQAVTI